MSKLPYNTHSGYGVIVAQLSTKTGDTLCASCRIPLEASKKELATAARYELPIMDRTCAEEYTKEGTN